MKPGSVSFYRYFPISKRDKEWGLYATTVGESRIAPAASYPPGGHPAGFKFDWHHGRVLDQFGLVYISAGRGQFESKPDNAFAVEAGHAFLFFPDIWHRYAPDPETGWHEHWIGFDGEIARRWLKRRFLSPRHPVIKFNTEDTVRATFTHVMEAVRANRPALQQILAGATANLLGLFCSAHQSKPADGDPHANFLGAAVSRIHDEFASNLDIKNLARELGVSYSWFRGTFKAHTGLSPHQYLLELRIARARALLVETALSVKQIATEAGFQDEHYFCRCFRRRLNFTPSAWRRRSRGRL
jgi:AraC-like DNA-binding protein